MTSPTPEIVTAAQPRHIALIASVLMSVAETKINRSIFARGGKKNKKQKLENFHGLFLKMRPGTEFTSRGLVLMSGPEQFSISVYC